MVTGVVVFSRRLLTILNNTLLAAIREASILASTSEAKLSKWPPYNFLQYFIFFFDIRILDFSLFFVCLYDDIRCKC